MSTKIGLDPENMTLGVPVNSAFTTTLELYDAADNPIDWGAATTLTIKFSDDNELAAEITDNEAAFVFTTDLTSGIAEGARADIWYANGDDNYPIWRGPVTR